MPYKAIIFDLDGTLLDSLEDIAGSMNEALRILGYPEHPLADYRYHVGDGMAVLAQRVLPEGKRDDASIRACVAEMRTRYAQRWGEKTRPYPGIPDVLDELTRRGLKMAVLSNKPHDFAQQVTATLLPRWTFDPVFGARPDIPHKPDPTSAKEIAEALGLAGSDCVLVGDTHADMRAAVGAGMLPVGVLWGFREAQELLDNGAKFILKEPRELLDVLTPCV